MKLKGVVVTQPACDWRFFLRPEARIARISQVPVRVRPDRMFLRRLGKMKDRHKLRIRWRPNDTLYFQCDKAISLPDRLPVDDALVHVFLRRVYLDFRALIRFELGAFSSRALHFPPTNGAPGDFARAFLEGHVTLKEPGQRRTMPVLNALPCLLTRFAEATTRRKHWPLEGPADCRLLSPLIQVLIEGQPNQILPAGQVLDDRQRTSLQLDSLRTAGGDVDVMYLAYHRDADADWVRLVRATVAWLHADLEVLAHILEEFDSQGRPKAACEYLSSTAAGLRAAPEESSATSRALQRLMKSFQVFHDNRLSRLSELLGGLGLPEGVKRHVRYVLSSGLAYAADTVEPQPNPQSIAEQLKAARAASASRLSMMIEMDEKDLRDTQLQIARQRPTPDVRLLRQEEYFSELLDKHKATLAGLHDVAAGESPIPTHWAIPITELARRFQTHYSRPSQERIWEFLRQFGSARRIGYALRLLDRVDFFDDMRIGEIFRDFYFKRLRTEIRKPIVFSGLGSLDDSSSLIGYLCSKALGADEKKGLKFRELKDVVRTYKKPADTAVVLLDDNVGSGKQVKRIFSEWLGEWKGECEFVAPLSLDEVTWVKRTEIVYFAITGFEEGIEQAEAELKTRGLRIRIIPGVRLREDQGCFGPAVTPFVDRGERDEAQKMAAEIGYSLFSDKTWPDKLRTERALGYGNSQKLIVFAYNTPTCTLPILWKEGIYDGKPWRPLFQRRV